MTTEKIETLLEITEREQMESVVRAHAMLRDRCSTAMMLDERELALVFQHLGGTLEPAVAAVELEARNYVGRVMELLRQVDSRLEELMAVVTTPPRTAHLGRSWMTEIKHIDEMIDTAQTLLDAPEWKGSAAEAHLTTVPAQIEALRSLRSQAVTAGESVIAVGALQNTIFEASAMLMVAAAIQVDVQPPGNYVPAALYRRTVGLVQILVALGEALDQQFSGEGTWKDSAKELSKGLEDATSGIGFEWPKATRDEDREKSGGGDDGRTGDVPGGPPRGPGAEDDEDDTLPGDDGTDEETEPGDDMGEDDDAAGSGPAEDETGTVDDSDGDGEADPGDGTDGHGEADPGDGDGDEVDGAEDSGTGGPDDETPAEGQPGDENSGEAGGPGDEGSADGDGGAAGDLGLPPVEEDPGPGAEQPPAEPEPEPAPEPEPVPVPEPEPAPVPEPEPEPEPTPEPAPVRPDPVPQPDPQPVPAEPGGGDWSAPKQPAPEPYDPEQAAWEEEQSAVTEEAWERIHQDRELAKDSLGQRTLMP